MDIVNTPVDLHVCLTSSAFIPLHSAQHLTCLKKGWRFISWPTLSRPEGVFRWHAPTLAALRMNLRLCACRNMSCGVVPSPSAVRQTGCSLCHDWSRAELTSTPPRASSCSWFRMQSTPTSRRCFLLSFHTMPILLYSALSLRHLNRRSETSWRFSHAWLWS